MPISADQWRAVTGLNNASHVPRRAYIRSQQVYTLWKSNRMNSFDCSASPYSALHMLRVVTCLVVIGLSLYMDCRLSSQSSSSVDGKSRGLIESPVVKGVLLQSSISMVAMLLLVQAGDVETNPGPTECLNPDDLNKVFRTVYDIRAKWRNLGIELGVKFGTLEAIERKRNHNPDDCLQEMLNDWIASEKATWKDMVVALKANSVEANGIAKEIEESILEEWEKPPGPKRAKTDSSIEVSSLSTTNSQNSDMSSSSLPVQSSSPTVTIHTEQKCSSEPMEDEPSPPCIPCPNKSMSATNDIRPEPITPTLALSQPSDSSTCPSQVDDNSKEPDPETPKSSASWKPRNYQLELARPGREGKNCIIVAPTGSGKTNVAWLIIQEHLKRMQCSTTQARIFFLVHTIRLAVQQTERLKAMASSAGIDVHIESVLRDMKINFKVVLSRQTPQIVVCTAGKLHAQVTKPTVSFDDISLIVVDECHHVHNNTVHAQLMKLYLQKKLKENVPQLPQIVGLTASPGIGDNPYLSEDKTVNHLLTLCAAMDATSGIVTVKEHKDELDRYSKTPKVLLEPISPRDSEDNVITLIENEMGKLEPKVFDSSNTLKLPSKQSMSYKTKLQQELKIREDSTNPNVRDNIGTLKLLICYWQALHKYMTLQFEDAMKVLDNYSDFPMNDETCTVHERNLKDGMLKLKVDLHGVTPQENRLFIQAKTNLLYHFRNKPTSRGIMFVKTFEQAKTLFKWTQELAENNRFLKPEIIAGRAHMSEAKQKKAMTSFESGECNFLVSTSVLEQGIDVPACNLVIQFQQVTNEIAKVQAEGRARAENSMVLTLVSTDSNMEYRDLRNTNRLELLKEVLDKNYDLSNEDFLKLELKTRQDQLLSETRKQIIKRKQQVSEGVRFKLLCKDCKEVACSGSDVYQLGKTSPQYVVPTEEFHVKFREEPSETKIASENVTVGNRITCKDCPKCWGRMCYFSDEDREFPALKCESFTFQKDDPRSPTISCKKWSKAPFMPMLFEKSPYALETIDNSN